jgi:hypothetical protein
MLNVENGHEVKLLRCWLLADPHVPKYAPVRLHNQRLVLHSLLSFK